MGRDLVAAGGRVLVGEEVTDIREDSAGVHVMTPFDEHTSDRVRRPAIGCRRRLGRGTGVARRTLPFRGVLGHGARTQEPREGSDLSGSGSGVPLPRCPTHSGRLRRRANRPERGVLNGSRRGPMRV